MSDAKDPFQRLTDDLRGLTLHPLPPAEVRRRGDLLRRRNTALVVAGSVAAVALVAAPLAYVATGSGRVDPDPAPPAPSITRETTPPSPVAEGWQGQIPETFPLARGYPQTNGDDGSPVRVTPDEPATEEFTLCGTRLWSPGAAIDVAGVIYTGEAEHSMGRTLALYPSDAVAEQAVDRVRDGVAACTSEVIGGTDQVYAGADGTAGDSSYVITHRYRQDGLFTTGATIYQFFRVGNAVLLTNDYGESGPELSSVNRAKDDAARNSAAVVEEMAVFAVTGPTT